jgi:cytochrome c oxidase cbb3-type subunit 3
MLAALCTIGQAVHGAADAPHAVDGRTVYRSQCYYCHGYAGDARTAAASVLSPPPLDFTTVGLSSLPRPRMLRAVAEGRPGTAMQGFAGRLAPAEIEAVVDYVRGTFMGRGPGPDRYHSEVNGWRDDAGASAAADYVTGARSLDEATASLSSEVRLARRLFLETCTACHLAGAGAVLSWTPEAVSYPPGNYPEDDAEPPAGPLDDFLRHARPPLLASPGPTVRRGERIYQDHCAHCHAADGSGASWIGTFLDPSPRDLATPGLLGAYSRAGLARVVRRGIPGTAMSAWDAVLDHDEVEAVVTYVLEAFGRNGD